jgi:hypothetical protein
VVNVCVRECERIYPYYQRIPRDKSGIPHLFYFYSLLEFLGNSRVEFLLLKKFPGTSYSVGEKLDGNSPTMGTPQPKRVY